MPELEIKVSDVDAEADTAEALRSLLQWIRSDEALERSTSGQLASSGEREPGQMGAAFDVLQLVLGSSLSAGSLAVSILQWRDARRRPTSITLRRGDREVAIPADGAMSEGAVRAITALLDDEQEQPAARAESGDDGSAS